jgi:molybdopterin/thiamine biosynthesis adenylyltransferase
MTGKRAEVGSRTVIGDSQIEICPAKRQYEHSELRIGTRQSARRPSILCSTSVPV